ncbi:hypothetical protein [Nocardia sp. CNY236]|uniref:hypothetical protein n=1 Tax=Nocardia sp. CNY236 TaxID=1169152 RepID=UPI0018C9C71C|nr:hypothetical protein [Nocardia sp. CNY236]
MSHSQNRWCLDAAYPRLPMPNPIPSGTRPGAATTPKTRPMAAMAMAADGSLPLLPAWLAPGAAVSGLVTLSLPSVSCAFSGRWCRRGDTSAMALETEGAPWAVTLGRRDSL